MMTRFLSFILLVILSSGLIAHEIPDFSANYSVKLNGLPAGELKRSLSTNNDGTRTFKSSTQAKGIFAFFKPDLVEETSIWQKNDQFIRPLSYLYQRTGGKKDKYLSLTFDWHTQRVHIDDKKHPWRLVLEKNTLDKLVYQLALMLDLSDKKTNIKYRIADGGKLKTYKIAILGEEVVSTPLGKIATIKLTRLRDRPKGRETTLWCAPTLNYLPVKLEHIEKGGTVFTASLRRLEGIATKHAFEPIKKNSTNIISP